MPCCHQRVSAMHDLRLLLRRALRGRVPRKCLRWREEPQGDGRVSRLARGSGNATRDTLSRNQADPVPIAATSPLSLSPGAEILPDAMHLRVWAPERRRVAVVVEDAVRREVALAPGGDG